MRQFLSDLVGNFIVLALLLGALFIAGRWMMALDDYLNPKIALVIPANDPARKCP